MYHSGTMRITEGQCTQMVQVDSTLNRCLQVSGVIHMNERFNRQRPKCLHDEEDGPCLYI